MGLLAIQEHQQVAIGTRFCADPASPSLSAAGTTVLRKVNSYYRRRGFPEPFEISSDYIRAKHYVGVVSIGSHFLEVLPKIDSFNDGPETFNSARTQLAQMIQVATGLKLGIGPLGSVAKFHFGVIEAFFRVYVDHLQVGLRSGLVRQYIEQSEPLLVLRGRWEIQKQIRLGATRPGLLASRFDHFTEDNSYNRLLKRALQITIKRSQASATKDRARKLLFLFEGVSDVSTSPNTAIRGRHTKHLDSCLDLAEFFLESTSPDVRAGKEAGFSTFFDMNKLFEEYVARSFQRLLPGRVHIQKTGKSLAIDADTGVEHFRLRPDILISGKSGQFLEVIDTKWKRLNLNERNLGISEADVYQVLAYAQQFGCERASLVYPSSAGVCGLIKKLKIQGRKEVIHVVALALDNVATFKEQLMRHWKDHLEVCQS